MRNYLLALLLFMCVSAIFSLPAPPAAIEKDKKLENSVLVERLANISPTEEKLTKQLKKTASGTLIELPADAQPKLRGCSSGDYGPYGCYAPDCNRACRTYEYYSGECVGGGCFCVYYDYYDYYFY